MCLFSIHIRTPDQEDWIWFFTPLTLFERLSRVWVDNSFCFAEVTGRGINYTTELCISQDCFPDAIYVYMYFYMKSFSFNLFPGMLLILLI